MVFALIVEGKRQQIQRNKLNILSIIGSSSSSDPYGCTQCDVFAPDYDGPPPIEMDLWVPDDYYYDDYYYDDYYDGGYYP